MSFTKPDDNLWQKNKGFKHAKVNREMLAIECNELDFPEDCLFHYYSHKLHRRICLERQLERQVNNSKNTIVTDKIFHGFNILKLLIIDIQLKLLIL